jgi:hypothetical protein
MGFLTIPSASVVQNNEVLWDFDQLTTSGWWDLSDSSTLYDAVTGGSLVASDAAIARIEDKSGNARHWKQSTSDNRATRKVSEINGLDIARFDGTNDGYVLDSDLTFTSSTILIAFKPSSTITNVTSGKVLFSGGLSTSNPGEILYGIGAFTSNFTDERLTCLLVAPFVPNPSLTQTYGYGKTNADIPASFTQTSWVWNNSSGVFAGTLNGSSDYATLSAAGGFAAGTRYPNAIRYLGYRGATNLNHFAVDICELVVVNSVLSTNDLQKAQGRLSWKWDNGASLPGGHPYKSTPPYV